MPKTCDNVTIERVEKTAQNEAVSSNSLLGKNSMNFVKFTEIPRSKSPMPERMVIGQVVIRKPCPTTTRSTLKSWMRKLIRARGMAFSVHEDDEQFAIRRDK